MPQNTIINPYIPMPVSIDAITTENELKDLKTFRLAFSNARDSGCFKFECGQFAMLSVPGAGECPVGIASSPLDEGYIEFTVKRYPYGVVTSALHNMSEGDCIGIRGPYGNSFPLKLMEYRNIVIIGGGFAFTTLRSLLRYLLHSTNRPRFGKISVIYGARNPGELLYKNELAEWRMRQDLYLYITVDKADAGWKDLEGFVPAIVQQTAPSSVNAVALVCGPPVMLKYTLPVLSSLGFNEDMIFTSLERKMSCGIGKCGKCNIEEKYICKDGPVFSYGSIKNFL